MVTRERYFSTDTTSHGFEGVVIAELNAFRYDRPKLSASIKSQAFPSFTVKGRIRLQNDLRVSYELVKDFMLTATLFERTTTSPRRWERLRMTSGPRSISWSFGD
jgi:hypothetical protein